MKNIAIMGFKHCGKTSVARLVAEKLGKRFVELDDMIAEIHREKTGEKLGCREVHKKHGPEHFRQLEALAVERLPGIKNAVIALGGGTIAYKADVSLLKSCCTLVYLRVSAEKLLQRIRARGIPAFLDKNDLPGSLAKELGRREPLYEKYADLELECSDLSPDQIADKLLPLLKKEGLQ